MPTGLLEVPVVEHDKPDCKMASECSPIDCSALVPISGFQEYITHVRDETGFNTTLLRFCQMEICGALWGVGNPDVSGIGVSLTTLRTI